MGTQSYHGEREGCGDWCEGAVSIHRERPEGVWNLIPETLVSHHWYILKTMYYKY